MRSLGAAAVIDYTREDPTQRVGHYDVILDIAGNRPLKRLRRALTPNGTLVLAGGEDGGRVFGGMGRTLWASLLSMFVRQKLRGLLALPKPGDLEALTTMIEAGQLTPVIERTYPLAAAPEAIRHMSEGHARGKLVVSLAPAG